MCESEHVAEGAISSQSHYLIVSFQVCMGYLVPKLSLKLQYWCISSSLLDLVRPRTSMNRRWRSSAHSNVLGNYTSTVYLSELVRCTLLVDLENESMLGFVEIQYQTDNGHVTIGRYVVRMITLVQCNFTSLHCRQLLSTRFRDM